METSRLLTMGAGISPSSAHPLKAIPMPLTTWFAGGLFGLSGFYTLAGFLKHLFTGNPDLALLYLVALGGSVAIGWMFTLCRRQEPDLSQ
jgi:hypothetical protein